MHHIRNFFGKCNIKHLNTNSKINRHIATKLADIILFFFIFITVISMCIMAYIYGKFNGFSDGILTIKNEKFNTIFFISWALIQIIYLYIGLTDCFGINPKNKNCTTHTYLYANAHNIFLLTILYIIFTLIILYLFVCIKLTNTDVGNLFSLIGIIITFSALSFAGRVSSVNSMIIVLSIFLLMQFGLLFWVLQ